MWRSSATDHFFDDGQEVTAVCARATYYDLAGNPSTTTELYRRRGERRSPK